MNQPIDATSTERPTAETPTVADGSGGPSRFGDPRERLASGEPIDADELVELCLLYTSPSPRD